MLKKKHALKEVSKEFSLVDNSILSLIIEKTNFKKEKYNLILTKTIVVYALIIMLALFSYAYKIIDKKVIVSILTLGTILLFTVYLFVIQHYNNVDKDLDEVINLLQTKFIIKNTKNK